MMGPGPMGPPLGGASMGPGQNGRPPSNFRHKKNWKFQEPVSREELKALKRKDFQFILPFLKRKIPAIIKALIVTISHAILAILPPLVLRLIIDTYLPQQNLPMVIQYGFILIALYFISYVVSVIQNRIMVITGQQVVRDVREAVFSKYLEFPMVYYEGNKRGTLLSIVTGDVNILSDSITSGIINLITALFSLVLVIVTVVTLDLWLGILISIMYPFIILSTRRIRSRMRKNFFEIRNQMAKMNANIEENVSGIRVAQSLAVENRSIEGFNQISQETYDLRMRSTNLFATMDAVMVINTYITLALMIGLGGYRYLNGAITIGTLIAIIQYSTQIMAPVQQLSQLYNMFLEAGAALLHIRQSMENVQYIPEPKTPTLLPDNIQGAITFQNVSFRYVPSVPLFDNFNLLIQPHEKIGIVGETGAGKSTLINIMTRLYDIQSGCITLDGIDIRNLRHQDLISCIAIVSQNVFLFSDTIANNIRFGRPTATDTEVMEAARLARADGFIKQRKEGYNSKLGDLGIGLSGGQRQLVAYARMILAHPKIAILDEATSNIDSYTENLIQQNMDDLFRQMTVIIIAHRFATLQRVDRLVVIRNGKIEAIGKHIDLLRTNQYYKELCEKQFSKM